MEEIKVIISRCVKKWYRYCLYFVISRYFTAHVYRCMPGVTESFQDRTITILVIHEKFLKILSSAHYSEVQLTYVQSLNIISCTCISAMLWSFNSLLVFGFSLKLTSDNDVKIHKAINSEYNCKTFTQTRSLFK